MRSRVGHVTRGLVASLLLVVGACSDDDDASPDTSPSPVTATTTTTTQTTSPAPTTTAAAPTTTRAPEPTAPPTTSVEDVKAEIAQDIVEFEQANYAALADPSLERLPAHLAAVAVPGSPVEASLTAYVTELVELGDGIIPGDPDIFSTMVEQVELVGAPPYSMAVANVCTVENRAQATLAENTSDSRVIVVEGSGDLRALRSIYEVRLTVDGWRLFDVRDGGQVFPGLDSCPAL